MINESGSCGRDFSCTSVTSLFAWLFMLVLWRWRSSAYRLPKSQPTTTNWYQQQILLSPFLLFLALLLLLMHFERFIFSSFFSLFMFIHIVIEDFCPESLGAARLHSNSTVARVCQLWVKIAYKHQKRASSKQKQILTCTKYQISHTLYIFIRF